MILLFLPLKISSNFDIISCCAVTKGLRMNFSIFSCKSWQFPDLFGFLNLRCPHGHTHTHTHKVRTKYANYIRLVKLR